MMETFKVLDKAIDDHIKQTNEDGVFVTGWALVASLSSPSHDATATDGYVTYTSEGLPHHAQIGLFQMAVDDRRNVGLLGTIAMAMGQALDDDEEDED